MKAKLGAGTLALAVLLAGCGGDGGNTATANGGAPVQTIPAPNGGNWTEMVQQTPEGGYRMGNPEAPVKLVEFASLTCPACAAFSAEGSEPLRNLIQTGQVSLEFRNFILSSPDIAASVLTRCLPPSAFFRVVEQLFATQREWMGRLDDAEAQQIQNLPPQQQVPAIARATELDQFFRQRGLPEGRMNQCLTNQQELERLVQMRETAATQYQIPGTPAFLINGELVDASRWSELEPLLRRAIGG